MKRLTINKNYVKRPDCGREEGVLFIDRIMSFLSDLSCKRCVLTIHSSGLYTVKDGNSTFTHLTLFCKIEIPNGEGML